MDISLYICVFSGLWLMFFLGYYCGIKHSENENEERVDETVDE